MAPRTCQVCFLALWSDWEQGAQVRVQLHQDCVCQRLNLNSDLVQSHGPSVALRSDTWKDRKGVDTNCVSAPQGPAEGTE